MSHELRNPDTDAGGGSIFYRPTFQKAGRSVFFHQLGKPRLLEPLDPAGFFDIFLCALHQRIKIVLFSDLSGARTVRLHCGKIISGVYQTAVPIHRGIPVRMGLVDGICSNRKGFLKDNMKTGLLML